MIDEHPDWFLAEEFDLFGQRVFDVSNPEVVNYIKFNQIRQVIYKQ